MDIRSILYNTGRVIRDHGDTHKYASYLLVGHDFTTRVEIQNKRVTTLITPHDERETSELMQDTSIKHYIKIVCELYGIAYELDSMTVEFGTDVST